MEEAKEGGRERKEQEEIERRREKEEWNMTQIIYQNEYFIQVIEW